MLKSGEDNESSKKTTIGLISKKETLHVQHTFFVHFFAVVLHDYNVKLPETSKLHVFFDHFFFTAAHFHLTLVAFSISHLVTAVTKFSCCSSNKKMSPLFFISRSKKSRPFLVELRWPTAYFLFFSVFLSLYISNLWK